jgi:arginyl-tRNA synthetase
LLTHDAEWAVARRLLDFGDAVARSAASCEPHILAHYLLELFAAPRWARQDRSS